MIKDELAAQLPTKPVAITFGDLIAFTHWQSIWIQADPRLSQQLSSLKWLATRSGNVLEFFDHTLSLREFNQTVHEGILLVTTPAVYDLQADVLLIPPTPCELTMALALS